MSARSVGGRVLELDDDRARAHAADAASEFHVAKAVLDDIDEWREAVATG